MTTGRCEKKKVSSERERTKNVSSERVAVSGKGQKNVSGERAAVSSNISEGYERNSPRDFIRFLNIAKGSCGELRTQLYITRELEYIDPDGFKDLMERRKTISTMLNGLTRSINLREAAE